MKTSKEWSQSRINYRGDLCGGYKGTVNVTLGLTSWKVLSNPETFSGGTSKTVGNAIPWGMCTCVGYFGLVEGGVGGGGVQFIRDVRSIT